MTTDTTKPPETVSVTIDGRQLDVPKGTLVIRAAEQLGITVPRFCDHPLLAPVGACRQCMVEVEGQRKPFTSCTTQCTEGMVVKTHLSSEVAAAAQEGQLEFLLINHPLDCPQCDKGGECPLQDQSLAHGAPDSRFVDDKRRYEKAIPISAQVLLDRERCVLCARCTRFSQEISGDPFIELFERGALQQVAIYEDEPYDSYYSGNVVQICPVGALTATSYRFHSRPFDLRSVNGVCNQCSNGCSLRVDVRHGEVQRQLARDNPEVNESWNCDKGRFGYEYVASPDRLEQPQVRGELGSLRPAAWISALRTAGRRLTAAIEAGGPSAVGVIAGGRITDEDAYAVSRFARDVLGTDNVDHRLRPRTDEERDVLGGIAGTVGPTYTNVEHAPVVVVAGLETEEEAPILHLRLRKAVRLHRQRVVVVGPVLGSLEGVAAQWIPTEVGGEAAALAALADDEHVRRSARATSEGADAGGAPGLVVLAGERLAQSPGALRAARDLASGLGGWFAWVPRKANARGAVDAGLLPGLLPGGRPLADPGPVAATWGRVPEAVGLDTREMLEAAVEGRITALYLVGVDLARDFEDPDLAQRALDAVDTLVVQDLLPNDTTHRADVLLPAAAAQERVGSFTTWEGRRQPFPRAVPAPGMAKEDWDIVRQLARAMGADLGWETAMDVRREAAPLMEDARAVLPAADAPVAPVDERAAGEYAVVVLDYLLGEGTMLTGAKALRDTARTPAAWVNDVDAAEAGLAPGAHVAVIGTTGRLELPVRVTTAVARGVVVVPANGPVPGGVLGAGHVRLEAAAGATAAGVAAAGGVA